MRVFAKLKLAVLFIVILLTAILFADCDCSQVGVSDDDDDDGGGDPGGGGGGGSGNSPGDCEKSFVYGDGVGQYVEGAWIDSTPDLYSNNWRLNDAAWVECEELIFVGHDIAENEGVALTYDDSAYIVESLPSVSGDWELTAIDSVGDTAVAVGGDWESGNAVIMTRIKGEWERVQSLPYVSDDWWLTDVSLTAADKGFAVGLDLQRGEPVLMELDNGDWNTQRPPEEGGITSYYLYAIEMHDKENGLAVGRNLDGSKGIAIWMTNGIWYFPVTPGDLGADWDLVDLALSEANQGILVGRRFDTSSGIILEFDKGPLDSMSLPDLADEWILNGAAIDGDTMLVSGYEKELGEGFVLRLESDEWILDGILPFKTTGIISG